MKTAELKQEIHNFIDNADERFLRLIYSMVESEQGESSSFFSKTDDEMIQRNKASQKSIDEGRTRDISEFKKDVAQWKKNQATM